MVPLAEVAEGWPEPVRREIVQLNLVDARLALPMETVERALKQGRIAFHWKQVRAFVKPAVPGSTSPHDTTVVEMPLKVVAPLFLQRQRETAKATPRIEVDKDIPNLFFGFPQPETEAAPPPKPADSNYYTWGDTDDTVNVDPTELKRGSSGNTARTSKFASPNDIVARASALPGVSGALIALPDGLMVAGRVPAEVNADTLAAFLPQIFGKVSQCTKELRMGELNNLNFTVGNVPWKIYRVNAIFFAAFGQAGQGLPTVDLAQLAAELDHKPK
jgi:predicted regulator of Ras-like GTPase activity (Roadblock/LC7/MglB family)